MDFKSEKIAGPEPEIATGSDLAESKLNFGHHKWFFEKNQKSFFNPFEGS